MKKSEIYKYAQCAVITSDIKITAKLEILRELMSREDFEKYIEDASEKGVTIDA